MFFGTPDRILLRTGKAGYRSMRLIKTPWLSHKLLSLILASEGRSRLVIVTQWNQSDQFRQLRTRCIHLRAED